MKTWRRAIRWVALVLTLTYPVAVYFGLQVLEPRTLGLLLLAIVLLRHFGAAERFAAGITTAEWIAFFALCGLSAGIFLSNHAGLLLLYPVAVSLSMLFVFARTLWKPPTMIERIARLSEPDLSQEGVRYTRKVTWAWCGFFLVNASLSAVSATGPREYWVLYNGLISYLLMGLLFGVEWLVRQSVRGRTVRGG